MALNPLFVTDFTTLKQELRLTGVPTTSDADTLIYQALAETRVTLVDRLGQSRVTELRAYAVSLNPATANEYMRLRATLVEIKMCRVRLMRKFPVMFREGRSSGNQSWNEVAIDRDMGGKELSLEITRLENEIEEDLIALNAGEDDNTTVRAAVIGPAYTNNYPGSVVFP